MKNKNVKKSKSKKDIRKNRDPGHNLEYNTDT